jgi:Fanconi anemia group J protein
MLAADQAARKHYCINQAVIKTGRIEEECETLNKDSNWGCK